MSKKEIIYSYYNEKLATDYNDYRLLGWESQEAQYKRFEVLLRAFPVECKRLLDVGCGIGSLYKYITDKGIKLQYTGVDIMNGMIEKAMMLNPDADFFCTDVFKSNMFNEGDFDLVFASGIFNLDLGNNHEFVKEAVALFYDISKHGFVINLLHPSSPDREPGYFYLDPEEACDIISKVCNDNVKIEVVQGYLPNDYSVVVSKDIPLPSRKFFGSTR